MPAKVLLKAERAAVSRPMIGRVPGDFDRRAAGASRGLVDSPRQHVCKIVTLTFRVTLVVAASIASGASAAELPAIVHKPVVDVLSATFEAQRRSRPSQRDTAVTVAQQGLWYALRMPADATGYVRVNEVRLAYAGVEDGAANVRVLMGGKAGQSRVTETAGVRGIEESDLKAAAFDRTELDGMVAQRVDGSCRIRIRRRTRLAGDQRGLRRRGQARQRAAARRPRKPRRRWPRPPRPSAACSAHWAGEVGSMLGSAAKAMPKSEDELAAEELALGPEITGRILGARPLWGDADAQRRVNVVGRWVAAQTSRPDLPWTFGVIDTPEVNAFAAPGGFILITRGLYELLSSDSELAAALGHEITHCVQRDHYKVIRKQEMTAAGKERALRDVKAGTDSVAGSYARRYVEEHGASIMMTALDREAEYAADAGAEIYLARAGMNPLALYSLLQKLAALGSESAMLAQLYKTHPPLDARIDRIYGRGYGALEQYTMRE